MEIELNNICYKDKLVDFSYKFGNSNVISIIGNSGSGKSLIGYVIMGLLKCDRGNILVDGSSNYDRYMLMKDVGYVFQNPRDHFFCDTVYEEIAFGLKQFKFKENKMDSQVRDSLKMVFLDDSYLSRKIDSLSSGEMERVAIASSLVLNPKVLILDEPTVYLDGKVRKELVKLVKMLKNRYHKTVIVMSNDMDFVCSVSDKYILMDKGSIVKKGNINDIMSDTYVMDDCGVEIPLPNQFVKMVRDRKGIELEYTCDIDLLIKEVVDNG